MVWVGVVFAILLLVVATVQADVEVHEFRLGLKGLYSLEWLQFRTGLRTQQEVELAVDALPGEDQLYALTRECVAGLPRCWWTRGPETLSLTLLAWVGLVTFLVGAWQGAPQYWLLAVSGAHVLLCFGWDIWVVTKFNFQMDLHQEAARTRVHETLSDDFELECEEDGYDLLTQTQLIDRVLVLESNELDRVSKRELAHRGNAPSTKLLYWVSIILAKAWMQRQRGKAQGLSDKICEIVERPLPLPEHRLLIRIRNQIEDTSERVLLGQGDDAEPRLERLRRIEANLVGAGSPDPRGAEYP